MEIRGSHRRGTTPLALSIPMALEALSASYRNRSGSRSPGGPSATTVLRAAFGCAVLVLCGAAGAQTVAGSTTARIQWEAASGPVAGYGVFISRNGAPYPASPDLTVSTPDAQVTGAYGDSVTVRVAAFTTSGTYGPFSPDSEPIRFVPAPSSVAQAEHASGDVAVVDANPAHVKGDETLVGVLESPAGE